MPTFRSLVGSCARPTFPLATPWRYLRRSTPCGRRIDLQVVSIDAQGHLVARLWAEHKTGAPFGVGQLEDYASDLAEHFNGPRQLITIVDRLEEASVDERWRRLTWRPVQLLDDYVVASRDRWLYVARVRNTSDNWALMEIHPTGELRDEDGETMATLDHPSQVEGTLNLRRVIHRQPADLVVEGVNFNPDRCLLTVDVRSRREMSDARIALLGWTAEGPPGWVSRELIGPVPRRRSRQVVARIGPEICREGLPRIDAYPAARPGELRRGVTSRA